MEVARNPSAPKLSAKAKKLITKLIFRKDDPVKKVDGIFVFSTVVCAKQLARLIEKLLRAKVSKQVFITGGFTPAETLVDMGIKADKTEADTVLAELDTGRFKDVKFFVERKSTNTYDNIRETLKMPEFKNCKKFLFIFKSHAAGRGYLTLRKFFLEAEILQKTFDAKYPKAIKKITRHNWHTFSFARNRVWGEFLRIKRYGGRDAIEYDSVRVLVEDIEKELK